MFPAASAALQLFTVAVLAVVSLPSVEGLVAKRGGQRPIGHSSEFLGYLQDAQIPKDEFLYPEGKEAEEYPGELDAVFDDVGKEELSNHPDRYKLFNDVLDKCGIAFRAADRSVGDSYFNVSRPSLVPLVVARNHSTRTDAAVIVAPGGGFDFLAWNGEGYEFAEVLLRLGVSAFILKYRVPTIGTRLQLLDGQRAVSYVRKNAKRFGLNPSRIGFAGFSAGGHLTVDVSTQTKRLYPRIDDVDDESYLPDFAIIGYGGGPAFITPEMRPPKTFMVHAKDDPCVPVFEDMMYCKALVEYGQVCDSHFYPGGGHGYSTCLGDAVSAPGQQFANFAWTDDAICAWPVEMERFLKKEVLGEHLGANYQPVLPHFLRRIREGRLLHRSMIRPEDMAPDIQVVPGQTTGSTMRLAPAL